MMKTLLVFVIFVLCGLANARRHSYHHSREHNYYGLKNFNNSVNSLIAASVLSPSNTTSYLWDLVSFVDRFILLNQTQVLSQTNWSVVLEIANNGNRLGWTSIPNNVQSIVSKQAVNLAFLNLTYAQLGWSSPNDAFANSVLFSFLPNDIVSYFPNISQIVNQLWFSQLINTTAVDRHTLNRIRKYSIENIIPNSPHHGRRFKRRAHGNRWGAPHTTIQQPVTATTVANQAIFTARNFLCRYWPC